MLKTKERVFLGSKVSKFRFHFQLTALTCFMCIWHNFKIPGDFVIIRAKTIPSIIFDRLCIEIKSSTNISYDFASRIMLFFISKIIMELWEKKMLSVWKLRCGFAFEENCFQLFKNKKAPFVADHKNTSKMNWSCFSQSL